MLEAQMPLGLALGAAGVLLGAVAVLGAAFARSRRQPHEEAAPLNQILHAKGGPKGSVNTQAVQPATQSSFLSFLGGGPSEVCDPEVPRDEHFRGKLNFKLAYDKDSRALLVHIIQAQDLKAMDIAGTSDPYVKATLLPHREETVVTKIHRKTLNPRFDQVLKFKGHSSKKIGESTLMMQVVDYDRFSRDDPIGEVLLPMHNVKLNNGPCYWKRLQQPTVPKEYKGEILLSLCYMPTSSKLTVAVVKAKDLPAKDVIGSSDPYVKLWLIQSGTKVEKKKTTVKSQSLAPVYNESFAFSLPPRSFLDEEVQLIVTVMDHDLISSNDEMGHAVVGSKGGTTGAKHWKEVIDHPDHPCAMWHKLTPKW